MSPLYSRASDLRLLEPALLPRLHVTPIHSWPQFQRAAATAECSVLLLEWLFVAGSFWRLVRFRERFPDHAVVLVTRKDAENARCLKDVVVEEVVWLCEAEHLLPAAIQRASLRGSLQQLAARVAGMEHLPARLREALLRALRSERPPRSIRDSRQPSGAIAAR